MCFPVINGFYDLININNSKMYTNFWIIILIVSHLNLSFSSEFMSKNDNLNKHRRAFNDVSTLKTITSAKPSGSILPTKQTAPKFTYTVWDDNGQICILAKFEAAFTINYVIQGGNAQLNLKIPSDAQFKGRCDDYLLDEKPVLDVYWRGGFTFRITFEKVGSDNWGINSMDLLYNTADSLFKGGMKGGKKVARSKEGSLKSFTAPLGKSYLCPSPPVINLYEPKTDKTLLLRLTNIQIQTFQVEKGKFAPIYRCAQVGFGSGVPAPIYISFEQDDSVPVIVGSITMMVSILTVVGYAAYRSWFVRRVEYDTMM